jgi:hypothetical protein
MTDRYNALTVILEHDIRCDDAGGIIAAIGMVRGVAQVIPHIADMNSAIAEGRARCKIEEKLWAILREGD